MITYRRNDAVSPAIPFGGESPEEALRRLERLPGPAYTRIIESDEGQALLALLRERQRVARRETRRAERAEGRP